MKRPDKPRLIRLWYTSGCNMNCGHCAVPVMASDLPLDELKSIVSKIYSWLGPFTLYLRGREPLVRRDLIDLIRYASILGISTDIVTNGLLVDSDFVTKIKPLKVSVNVSIDSLSGLHNRLRKSENALEYSKRAIELLTG